MTWAVLLFLIAYAAMKAAQLAFRGKSSGYRAAPVSLGRRLWAGEPWLVMVAAIATVPPALAATSYHRHKFDAVLQTSVTCYGLIYGYQDALEIKRYYGEHVVYEGVYGYRSTALDAGWQLGQGPAATQRQLDRAAKIASLEQSGAVDANRRASLSRIRQCLRPPVELPNA